MGSRLSFLTPTSREPLFYAGSQDFPTICVMQYDVTSPRHHIFDIALLQQFLKPSIRGYWPHFKLWLLDISRHPVFPSFVLLLLLLPVLLLHMGLLLISSCCLSCCSSCASSSRPPATPPTAARAAPVPTTAHSPDSWTPRVPRAPPQMQTATHILDKRTPKCLEDSQRATPHANGSLHPCPLSIQCAQWAAPNASDSLYHRQLEPQLVEIDRSKINYE